jgi:uncharacterized membrane protein YdjX (TVP38/TMEM64 family)
MKEFLKTMTKKIKLRRILFWLLIALPALILILVLFQHLQAMPFQDWANSAIDSAEKSGPQGVLVFAGIYILGTLCLFPCALLTIAAGVMYGAWGIPLVIVSATVGAAIAFALARYFAFHRINLLVEKRPVTRALRKALEKEGLMFMILLRFSPVIPFNLNNYLLGTAPVRFSSFIFATFIGTFPGTFLYIYVGTFGRGQSANEGLKWALFLLGLVATVGLGRLAVSRTRLILRSP